LSVEKAEALLASADYLADRRLATAVFLALELERPLFLEGEAGVGKTELAKALAKGLGRDLIRLQCYEGLDISSAVYEWNVQRQMTAIRVAEAAGAVDRAALERDIFSAEYLIERPILRALRPAVRPEPAIPVRPEPAIPVRPEPAIPVRPEPAIPVRPEPVEGRNQNEPESSSPSTSSGRTATSSGRTAGEAPVLLIDELDRADEPFEAYLLEVLSDFQVTIPELGVIRAAKPPVVVVTSNRTREIHDAIKRRCLYHWVDYPDARRELEIVRRKAPGAAERLSREVVAFVQRLRGLDLFKAPGVAETIDWTRALMMLDAVALEPGAVGDTLGALLKYQDDIAKFPPDRIAELVAEAQL